MEHEHQIITPSVLTFLFISNGKRRCSSEVDVTNRLCLFLVLIVSYFFKGPVKYENLVVAEERRSSPNLSFDPKNHSSRWTYQDVPCVRTEHEQNSGQLRKYRTSVTVRY